MTTKDLNCTVPSSDSTPFLKSLLCLWRSWKHVAFSAALVALSVVALQGLWRPLGGITIAVTDCYLLLLLWSATIQSAHGCETWPGLPMRESAVIVIPMVFASLVIAFAALYRSHAPGIESDLGAIYSSLINFGSFTYDGAEATPPALRFTAAAQLLSGILLLICALPLLVSRLTNLDSPKIEAAPVWTAVSFSLASEPLNITAVRLVPSEGGQHLEVVLETARREKKANGG